MSGFRVYQALTASIAFLLEFSNRLVIFSTL